MLQLHLRLKTCQLMSFPATSTWRRLPWRRDSTYLALGAAYLATCTDGNTGRGIHTQRMKIWPKIWISCLALCFMMIWPHWSQKMLLSSWHTADQSKAVEYGKPSTCISSKKNYTNVILLNRSCFYLSLCLDTTYVRLDPANPINGGSPSLYSHICNEKLVSVAFKWYHFEQLICELRWVMVVPLINY